MIASYTSTVSSSAEPLMKAYRTALSMLPLVTFLLPPTSVVLFALTHPVSNK